MPLVLLDAGLVGLAITRPRGRSPQRDAEAIAFRAWLDQTADGCLAELGDLGIAQPARL